MRKLFAAVAVLCFAALSFGQTATITGHLITPQNGASSSGVSILFELTNDNGQQCRLAGTGIIVPYQQTFTQAQLAAGVSLIPNSTLTCGTTTGASRWRYTVKSGGTGTRQCSLNITGNVNLDNAACLNATATPVTATPTDSVYCRIDGSNCGFTGNVTHAGNNDTGIGTLGAVTATISGNETVGGTLGVTGAFTAGSFTNNLSVFAATTSAQLAGIISDEVGSGPLAFATNTPLTNPTIDTINQKAATVFTLKDNTGGTRLSIPSNGTSQSTLNNTLITGGSTINNGAFTGSETGMVLTGATTGNNLTILNAQGAVGPVTGTSGDAVLYTYTLPANTIDTNTKSLSVRCAATHTTGTANTTLKVNVNGVNITSLASGTTASQSTSMDVEILRTGTTTAGTSGIVAAATGTSGAFSISATGLAWTSSQVVTCTFNVAATDTWSGVMFVVKQNQ